MFLCIISNNIFAQDIRYSLEGKWAESEVLITNNSCAFDSTKFVFNDWTFNFLDNGKFIENSAIVCNNDTLIIKGRWKYNNTLSLKRNVRCIRWSKEYNYGRDIIGEIKWITPSLWYICLASEGQQNNEYGIIAYRKVSG